MEWNLLGYSGPTVLVVKTTMDAVIGAFTVAGWKDSKDFYGTAECFLFRLKPTLRVFRPTCTKGNNHFMYLHSESGSFRSSLATSNKMHGSPHGLGFGGTLSHPRLFIPEAFENCTAGALDKTFDAGPLLPPEQLETFDIKCLEVWGVGRPEVIEKGLQDRESRREATASLIKRARIVSDKTAFVKDLESGLVPNSLYDHQKHARGRHDFRVDEQHGGYKIEGH